MKMNDLPYSTNGNKEGKLMQISSLKKLNKNNVHLITFKHFQIASTSQPYFIWAPRNINGELINLAPTDINGFELYKKENTQIDTNNAELNPDSEFSAILDTDEDNVGDENDIHNEYFNKQFQQFLNSNWDYASENQSLFAQAYKQCVDFLIKKLNLSLENIYFNSRIRPLEQLHLAVEDFQNFINNKTQSLIIDPIFTYLISPENESDYVVKATAFAYDKNSKILYINKFKDSTSLSDYLQTNFIYNTATKMGVEIKDIQFVLVDPDESKHKKGHVPFIISRSAFSANTKSSVSRNKDYRKLKDPNEVRIVGMKNSGVAIQYGICDGVQTTIMNAMIERKVWGNPRSKTIADLVKKLDTGDPKPSIEISTKFEFEPYEQIIEKIINASKVQIPTYSKFNPDLKQYQLDMDLDNSSWGKNPDLKRIAFLHMGEQYAFSTGNSGTANSLKKLDINFINKQRSIVENLYSFPNFFTDKALELISPLMSKDTKIVWYDYEGLSSIVPIFDGLKSYNQIAHQVSIIVTQNGSIVYEEDILHDPKTVSLIDLVKVILAVYQQKADYYVVFNKGYENTRNLEVRDQVLKHYQQNDTEFIAEMRALGIESLLDFESIVLYINENTIDLMDFFTKDSDTTNQAFYSVDYVKHSEYHNPSFNLSIHDFKGNKANYQEECDKFRRQIFKKNIKAVKIIELLGYTSIKKLEKLITKNNYKYDYEIKEYAGLEVKNGSMALEIAINRFAGYIGEHEWAHKSLKLKEYCHNDVVAMIVVYEFLLGFIASVFPDIYDFKNKLAKGQILKVDFDTKKLTT
ncbi:UU173 family protein [Mycoplasmopsis californica]|nr:DUF2779 domain-containing protein [Mycoplasmopsis californica]